MRIRKQYQVIPTNALLENGDSTSATNGYTANYINNHSVVVSPTEPTTDRKKVWLQHSNNLLKFTVNLDSYATTEKISASEIIITSTNPNPIQPTTTLLTGELDASTYTIKNYSSKRLYIQTSSGDYSNYIDTNQSYTFTYDGISYLRLVFATQTQNETVTYKAQLEKGEVTTTYEPCVQDKMYILNANNIYEEYAPQNEIYSTDEVRIGTWLGKPLYRKVLTGTMPSNAFVDIPINVSNIDISNTMVEIGYTKASSGTRPIPFINTSIDTTIAAHPIVSNNTNYIRVATNTTNYSGYQFYIPIRYTKTTD